MCTEASLHQALLDDNASEVTSLIDSGANVNVIYQKETAFTRAMCIQHYNSADAIICSRSFDPNTPNQFNQTPIYMAAKEGRVDYIHRLLKMGAEVNAADIRGVTPLAATTWHDKHEAADVLLQHGANINQQDVMGHTPLYRACCQASIKVVSLLLHHKCDVNLTSKEKKTPLMAALPSFYNYHVARKKISEMLAICEMLIKAGCSINSQDCHGKTALHHVVESNDVYGLCLLAENDCDLEVEDSWGCTPFQRAVHPNRPVYDIARYLLHYGAKTSLMPNPCGQWPPLLSPLSVLLNSQPKLQEKEKLRSRALLLRTLCAAVYPHASAASQSQRDHSSQQDEKLAFHEAIERDVVKWLSSRVPCTLQHQARLQVRRTLGSENHICKVNRLPITHHLKQYLTLDLQSGCKPLSTIFQLHLNIQDFKNENVKLILVRELDMNISVHEKTPLALALDIRNIEAARAILDNHPRPGLTFVNAEGDSALHLTARLGIESLIPRLLQLGLDVEAKNIKGCTPLLEAALAGKFDVMAALIKNGADVKKCDSRGIPLIHLVAASGAADIVELLLEKGVDPNLLDPWGNSPLHVAAAKGGSYLQRTISLPGLYGDQILASMDVMQMMLTDGQPKYTKKLGHMAVIQSLLRRGADVCRLNAQNQTALQCADMYKATDIQELLKDKSRILD